MDLNNVRRVSSAGYRLPDRAYGTKPITTQQPVDTTRHAEPNPDRRDPVKQDRVWKEAVLGERRGVREWEKKWNFLRNYDQMGQLKPEEPLPSYVSLFSSCVPNTSSQLVGSRLSSPLGSELVRLDRLLLWSHHKCLQDPEMLPG
ncbi:ciliary microtubule inner protein 5 [Lycodopsis pacificus]